MLALINDPGVALPGFWYLFAVDMAGVPSVSWTMQVETRLPTSFQSWNTSWFFQLLSVPSHKGIALSAPMTLIQALNMHVRRPCASLLSEWKNRHDPMIRL